MLSSSHSALLTNSSPASDVSCGVRKRCVQKMKFILFSTCCEAACFRNSFSYQSQMFASGRGPSEIAESQLSLRYLLHCQISLLLNYLNIFRNAREDKNSGSITLSSVKGFVVHFQNHMVHSESCSRAAVYKMLMCY